MTGKANGNGKQPDPRSAGPLTDIGNAERLLQQHGENMRMVPQWNRWLVYDGGRWKPDTTRQVERFAKQSVRALLQAAWDEEDKDTRARLVKHAAASEGNSKIKAMLERAQAEDGVALAQSALDADPWLLNLANGTMDLRTGVLREHSRDDLLTKMAPVVYDADAKCPTWMAFLQRIMRDDAEMIAFLQRAVGYSLSGDTGERCLFFLHGFQGANGKSTFLDVLHSMLGDYAVQADFTTFLETKADGPRNDVARLVGARMVSSSEAGEGKRLNESLLKTMTGNDVVTARFLYAEAFEFRPSFKLWLAANHKPVIRGTDGAIWERIRLLPFTVTIPVGERDAALAEKLKAELPGILRWAVDGCQSWLEGELKPPANVTLATSEYRTESDTLGAFLEEMTEAGPDFGALTRELFAAYSSWAERSRERAMTLTAFGRALSERGYEKEKQGHDNTVWRLGLRLRSPAWNGTNSTDGPGQSDANRPKFTKPLPPML